MIQQAMHQPLALPFQSLEVASEVCQQGRRQTNVHLRDNSSPDRASVLERHIDSVQRAGLPLGAICVWIGGVDDRCRQAIVLVLP